MFKLNLPNTYSQWAKDFDRNSATGFTQSILQIWSYPRARCVRSINAVSALSLATLLLTL